MENCDGVPDDYFFRQFLGLQRVLSLMANGNAFTRERPAFVNTVMVNRQELACSQIAYSNDIIAIGKWNMVMNCLLSVFKKFSNRQGKRKKIMNF